RPRLRLPRLRKLRGGHETYTTERSDRQPPCRENSPAAHLPGRLFFTVLFFAHACSSEAVREARVIETAADTEWRIGVVIRETRDTLVRRHQNVRILVEQVVRAKRQLCAVGKAVLDIEIHEYLRRDRVVELRASRR